jgi:protein gp37
MNGYTVAPDAEFEMASKSNIEWTGHTWNPIAGCSVLTPGCTNCYAMKLAARLGRMNQPLYAGLTKQTKGGAVWTGEMRRASEDVLLAPLRRRKPTTYFVNSMSDLFHENVPDQWIDAIFAVMALCRQHTFQILTKRANRMHAYMANVEREALWMNNVADLFEIDGSLLNGRYPVMAQREPWLPLPNVWLGVSTERQQEADERIPLLLQTPAAIRFISAEPLLGPIELDAVPFTLMPGYFGSPLGWHHRPYADRHVPYPKLSWAIIGGESGHGYRPMAAEWAYSLRDQCVAADVAVFVKQMAGRQPIPEDLLTRQFPL